MPSAGPLIGDGISVGGAVKAEGDCHPFIEGNAALVSYMYAGLSFSGVVQCRDERGIPSRCVVVRTPRLRNEATSAKSINGTPRLDATGIACSGGSCARIEENDIFGVVLSTSGAERGNKVATGVAANGGEILVERNVIHGVTRWCGSQGVGLHLSDARGIVRNNKIFGITEPVAVTFPGCTYFSLGIGMNVTGGDVVAHSNLISAYHPGPLAQCGDTSRSFSDFRGVELGASDSAFRNNIIAAGACREGAAFVETAATADPVVFENNVLHAGDRNGPLWWQTGAQCQGTGLLQPICGALYYDAGGSQQVLFTADQVNALTDMTASGNTHELCALSSDFSLVAGSACIDAGTPAGAPFFDIDGDPRDALPDIGPDEYVP